jgi:hypothetical protein
MSSAISTETTELRHRAVHSSSGVSVTDEGRKTDKFLDSHNRSVLGFYLQKLIYDVVSKVGVRRSVGGHSHDDRFPDSHVLSVDMPLVL